MAKFFLEFPKTAVILDNNLASTLYTHDCSVFVCHGCSLHPGNQVFSPSLGSTTAWPGHLAYSEK
jgi:hypothetical protein